MWWASGKKKSGAFVSSEFFGETLGGKIKAEGVLLQVGRVGALLSSCSAAGRWRVSDLAGLGRDDLFSGLRYVRSCVTSTKSVDNDNKKERFGPLPSLA